MLIKIGERLTFCYGNSPIKIKKYYTWDMYAAKLKSIYSNLLK
jgi:hypothetical protein